MKSLSAKSWLFLGTLILAGAIFLTFLKRSLDNEVTLEPNSLYYEVNPAEVVKLTYTTDKYVFLAERESGTGFSTLSVRESGAANGHSCAASKEFKNAVQSFFKMVVREQVSKQQAGKNYSVKLGVLTIQDSTKTPDNENKFTFYSDPSGSKLLVSNEGVYFVPALSIDMFSMFEGACNIAE